MNCSSSWRQNHLLPDESYCGVLPLLSLSALLCEESPASIVLRRSSCTLRQQLAPSAGAKQLWGSEGRVLWRGESTTGGGARRAGPSGVQPGNRPWPGWEVGHPPPTPSAPGWPIEASRAPFPPMTFPNAPLLFLPPTTPHPPLPPCPPACRLVNIQQPMVPLEWRSGL